MTIIKIPDMESVKKIFEQVEREILQIELKEKHICDGCTELLLGQNEKPFCAVDKCIKEYYQDKDDYLAFQDNEIYEMRRKR